MKICTTSCLSSSGRKGEQRLTNVVRSSFDLLVEFVLVLIPERRVPNQEDVEDHTYTQKHIHCLSDKQEKCGGGSKKQRAYHMPRCLQVYHTPLSSALLETSSRESPQNLHMETHQKMRT